MVNKMRNFQSWGRGVALASSTLALGSALAISSSISSAQAASLGAINVTGGAIIGNLTDISPNNDTISFTAPFTTVSSSGPFSGLVASAISTINLERTGTGEEVLGVTLTPYSATTTAPFISFVDGSNFVVDDPSVAARNFTPGNDENIVGYTLPQLRGTFFSNTGEFLSEGILTANQISGTDVDGSFSFTLSALSVGGGQPVPEPATTGAFVALGIGALFTNNVVKKKKVKINA